MTNIHYIKLERFADLTGYTVKALRRKMENGVWIRDQHYRKAPDGNIMVNIDVYNRWVEGKAA
ncbi:MAG: excisionase [Proteobacteria bacterium]|nr:excisionase [Pseudomonadota bacterium]